MGKDWRDPPPPPLGAAAHFAYSRVPRDRAWAVVFAVVWAGAVAGGVFAVLHRNAAAFLHTDFDDPASCPYTPNDAHRALLEAAAKKAEGDWSFGAFLHLAGGWLAVSAALALALGAAFVHLFKHHSGVMTRATIGAQVAIPAALALAALLTGQAWGALLFGGLAALTAFCFYLWRDQIELATRLLGVSAHGLAANGGIIAATVALNLASLLAVAPLAVFLAFAFMNGEAVPNSARDPVAKECVTPEGTPVLCCSWSPNLFAQIYMSAASLLILWTMLLANQIRVFVTSGAVAQWYFAPADALSAPKGTTALSMRHALGPSLGSLCLSSLVLTVAETVRSALDSAQNDNGSGELNALVLVKACLICVAQCLLSLLEYVTKFATVMMAISGEAFMAAGRHVSDLLLRNMLAAFASTVWFTPMVIRMACLMLSAVWALASAGAYWGMHRAASADGAPGVNAAVLGVSVFVITQFVLSFLGGILLSVLDAVFICWAIDKDSQTVSHPEVYAVLQAVPIPGAVVEQPDGGISYGAGQAPPPPQGSHLYQPPGVTHV